MGREKCVEAKTEDRPGLGYRSRCFANRPAIIILHDKSRLGNRDKQITSNV